MARLRLHLKVSMQTTPGGAWIPANLHGGGGPPPPPGGLPPPPPPGVPPPPPPPGVPPAPPGGPPPFDPYAPGGPYAPSAPPMPEGGFGSPNARRRPRDGDGDGGDRRVRPRQRKLEDSEEQTIEQEEAESENEGAYKKNPEKALHIQKKKRSQNKKSLTHLTQLPLLGELSADDTEKGGDNKRVQKKALQMCKKDMKTSPETEEEFILRIEGPADLTEQECPKILHACADD